MKINQMPFLFTFLFLFLFLSSCSNSNTIEGVGNNVGNIKNTLTGKEGLNLELRTSGKLETIRSGGELNFIFLLENKGRYSTDKFILVKPIIDDRYLNINLKGDFSFSEEYNELIKGKNLMNSGSEPILISGIINAKQLSEVEDRRTENLVFNYCYKYGTLFEDEFCVDTDIYGLSPEKKLCSIERKSYSIGQGAPLEINKVEVSYEEINNRVSPIISFEILNSNSGKILTKHGYDVSCKNTDSEINNILKNMAELKVISFSYLTLEDFECNSIEFNENKAEVTCKLKNSEKGFEKANGNFYGKLNIELEYYYQNSLVFDLSIEK